MRKHLFLFPETWNDRVAAEVTMGRDPDSYGAGVQPRCSASWPTPSPLHHYGLLMGRQGPGQTRRLENLKAGEYEVVFLKVWIVGRRGHFSFLFFICLFFGGGN